MSILKVNYGDIGGGLDEANMTSSVVTYQGVLSDCDTILSCKIHVNTQIAANNGVIGTVTPAPATDTFGVAVYDGSGTRTIKLQTDGTLINVTNATMVAGYDWDISLAYKKA